jgi:hypothetical protein
LRDRAGRGALGCLVSIAVLALIAYTAVQFVPPWMHYAQFRDEMRANARFGTTLADSSIKTRLVAQVDSLHLPPEAKKITIRRRGGRPPTITISAEYDERVKVPIFGIKILHFKPSVRESL